VARLHAGWVEAGADLFLTRPPERIAELAADMAVQVNCWD